jgi:regulator of microtubule dynamics protein 3
MERLIRKIIFVVSAWLTFVSYATCASVPADELIKEANQLYRQFKDREALAKFQMVLLQQPSNYEALYKTSLLNTRIGLRYADETEKLEYLAAAKGYAELALAANEEGADSHYAFALAVHNYSIVSGAKERILNIRLVKRHLEKTLRLNPQHAGAWQLLGRWHYKVANFNFLETAAAELLINGVPRGATNEKAIEAIRKSITYDPQNISGYYDLAVIYQDMKLKAESVAVLQDALALKLVTSEDLEISRRCKAMLVSMKVDPTVGKDTTVAKSIAHH